jgi:hypothetical protein
MSKILKLEDFKANTKEWFLEQLGNMSTSQALQTISDLYDELHKPKYPKTYEECRKILGLNDEMQAINMWYKMGLIIDFYELIICRDAYWKIAGEELGLGKPWEPDFSNDSPKYNIFKYENGITLSDNNWSNRILVFPTIEMRDAFYNNFKFLIDQCKELL